MGRVWVRVCVQVRVGAWARVWMRVRTLRRGGSLTSEGWEGSTASGHGCRASTSPSGSGAGAAWLGLALGLGLGCGIGIGQGLGARG